MATPKKLSLDELCSLAEELGLTEDDLETSVQDAADNMIDDVNEDLESQLEFLFDYGRHSNLADELRDIAEAKKRNA